MSDLDQLDECLRISRSTLDAAQQFREKRDRAIHRVRAEFAKQLDDRDNEVNGDDEDSDLDESIRRLLAVDKVAQWTGWALYVKRAAEDGLAAVGDNNWRALEVNLRRLTAAHRLLEVYPGIFVSK